MAIKKCIGQYEKETKNDNEQRLIDLDCKPYIKLKRSAEIHKNRRLLAKFDEDFKEKMKSYRTKNVVIKKNCQYKFYEKISVAIRESIQIWWNYFKEKTINIAK